MNDKTSSTRIPFLTALLRTAIKLLPWELAHIGNNLPVPVWYMDEPEFRIAFLISGILMALYIATPLFRSDRRTIHDLVAGTVVKRNQ